MNNHTALPVSRTPQDIWRKSVDGGTLELPATLWRNPTGTRWSEEFQFDELRWVPWHEWARRNPALAERDLITNGARRDKLLPQEMVRFTIEPGCEALIPSMFDRAIQTTQCHHAACAKMPFACSEPDHPKSIVGGLGTRLDRIRPLAQNVELAGAYRPHQISPSAFTIDDRLVARARGLK